LKAAAFLYLSFVIAWLCAGRMPGDRAIQKRTCHVEPQRDIFYLSHSEESRNPVPFLRQSIYSCIFSRGCIQDIARHNIQKFICSKIYLAKYIKTYIIDT